MGNVLLKCPPSLTSKWRQKFTTRKKTAHKFNLKDKMNAHK